MKVIDLKIRNAKKIFLKKIKDKRGFFLKTYDYEKFIKKNIKFNIKQVNLSFFKKMNTFKGMHYQTGRYSDKKIVFCLSGKVRVFLRDCNRLSKTNKIHMKITLNEKSNYVLLIPKMCAVGYLSLSPNSLLLYFSNNYYSAENENVFKIKNTNLIKNKKLLILSKKDS